MIWQVDSVTDIIYILAATLVALALHEFGHAYIAYKCGDNTARNMGRLTLNPIKHLDFFGFLCMLVAGFGWAKPVPVNYRNLNKPRRDIALVSLAGPMMNIILAFIGDLLAHLMLTIMVHTELVVVYNGAFYYTEATFFYNLLSNAEIFFSYFCLLNLGLALFNLIPIPPLDGSKILSSLLPPSLSAKYLMLEKYSSIFMLILLIASRTSSVNIFYPISYLRDIIIKGFDWLITLPSFMY